MGLYTIPATFPNGSTCMPEKNTLMIVDDNEDFHYLYGLVAQAAGFAVEHIFNGQEALQRLEREPIPTLVLLDTRLPGIAGDEILRLARSNKKWALVPIFMITADRRAVERYQTRASDAPHLEGIIEKGPDTIKRLRELFEKYRVMQPG
jgi:CheY-like chemotaxis protein